MVPSRRFFFGSKTLQAKDETDISLTDLTLTD